MVAFTFVWACSSDDTSSSSSSGFFPTTSGGTPSQEGVDCSHPGAGRSLGNDRCECTTTRDVSGRWSTKRTCREFTSCPIQDAEDVFTITQTGTNIRAESATQSFTGTICGDYIVWEGGPKDDSLFECGQVRFTEDNRFVSDSCYVERGAACFREFGKGCPSQKGHCTGTGAKEPEAAPAIVKDVCN